MPTLNLPRGFDDLTVGSALTGIEDRGAAVFVRLDDGVVSRLPRLCLLDARLGAWEYDGAIATALLVRVEKKIEMTYQVWIDGAAPSGVAVLKNLARQRDVIVHLVSDNNRRTLRTRNNLSIRARRLVAELQTRKTWAREQFNRATGKLDTLYPTYSRLWVAIRDAKFPF